MIILLSGGLDSTAMAATLLRGQAYEIEALSFDYGQRHKAAELRAAAAVAAHYGLRHDIVDLSSLTPLISSSALTGAQEVPEGHYAEDTMRATVVPNRNAIMLSIAVGVAASRGHTEVATAVHAGDHPIYPDCRPDFITSMSRTALLATKGHGDVSVYAPFVHRSKADIVQTGDMLDAPLHLTWSCYQGGEQHCGRCGTCVERAEAFFLAGVADPTSYADHDFWHEAVKAAGTEASA